MKWNHLPLAGGLYDQHPDLIEGFEVIFAARAEHEAQEQQKRERESKNKSRVAGSRRRR